MLGGYNQVILHINRNFGVACDAGNNPFYCLRKEAKQRRRRAASKRQNRVEIIIFFQLVAEQPQSPRRTGMSLKALSISSLAMRAFLPALTSNRTALSTLQGFNEKVVMSIKSLRDSPAELEDHAEASILFGEYPQSARDETWEQGDF